MRRCVWSRNLKNEEAMARVGPQRHRREKKKSQKSGNLIYTEVEAWNLNSLQHTLN